MSAGGAPLDPAVKAGMEALTGAVLHNGYGLTEAAPTVTQTRLDQPRSDDSIGPALTGVELRFVDTEGRDVPAGEIGELWVRGPNVMKGYYRDPGLTQQTITPEGWLKTGDLCRIAPDGAVFLRGDSNGDGVMDISDPAATLGYLFLGDAALDCLDAADADDSGALDISDAVVALDHLFLSGLPLPEPAAAPGPDPTPDDLSCARSQDSTP